MRRLVIAAVCVVGFLAPALGAEPVGMFGGTVVRGGAQDPPGKWIYVRGRGSMVRRVEISKASIDYSTSVPRAARSAIATDDLREGTLVQVAASQDKTGEWVARSVLIMRLASREGRQTAIVSHPSVRDRVHNDLGVRYDFLSARYSSNAARNLSMSAFSR